MLTSFLVFANSSIVQLISLFVDYGLMIAAYVFKCIALYTMAKKQNLKNIWMCFVPFLNFIVIGKLIGEAVVWGVKVKNIGLIVCILSFVSFVLSLAYNFRTFADMFLKVPDGGSVTFTSGFLNFLYNINSTSKVINVVLYFFNMILSLAQIVFEVSMIFLIFRKYNPQRAMLFSILSIFFESLFGIFLFVSRNNDPVDFSAYRVYERRYYGGYPGNNDNGGNGASGNANGGTPAPDPFPEFDNKSGSGSDNSFYNGGSGANGNANGNGTGGAGGASGGDDLFDN